MCTDDAKKSKEKFLESDKVPASKDPGMLKADTLYKALAVCRGIAQQLFEAQHALNDKLINHPSGGGEKKDPSPDRAENPHHIPNWTDKTRDITEVLEATSVLQQRLLSHL